MSFIILNNRCPDWRVIFKMSKRVQLIHILSVNKEIIPETKMLNHVSYFHLFNIQFSKNFKIILFEHVFLFYIFDIFIFHLLLKLVKLKWQIKMKQFQYLLFNLEDFHSKQFRSKFPLGIVVCNCKWIRKWENSFLNKN